MASRVCWNCEKHAHQTRQGDPFREHGVVEASNVWFGIYQCDACGYGSLGRLTLARNDLTSGASSLTETAIGDGVKTRVRAAFDQPSAPVAWLPYSMLGRRFDDVPEQIAAAASEAWACHSISQYRASVLMARAVVESVAKANGHGSGTLAAKIDEMRTAELIPERIKLAAHEIRYIGNEMAHGDFVTAIDEESCADVLSFMNELLNEVYQGPARLDAFRAARLARSQAAATSP